ncbi:MAG TPA: hypothetical protein DGT23_27315, partial [Micromonosporaceae bacterium]|nr:hypothetical protein [Micromonosporaceae bacterium]
QRAEKGECRLLRIVIAPGPYLGRFLTSLEELDRELTAQVEYGVTEHVDRLATGRLEAAVIGYAPEFQLSLPPGLRARHLVNAEPCWVAMSESHPLAGQADLELSELAKEDWITPPGGDHDGTTALFEAACRSAGFAPRVRYRLDDVSAVTQLLASTQALIIAQPTCRRTPGVVVRPLRGNPMLFRVSFVWRAATLSDPDADEIFRLLVSAYSAVIGTNDPYPKWWDENPWAHLDPAWAAFQATSSS